MRQGAKEIERLEAELARLRCPKVERPTVEGWWWYRDSPASPRIVYVLRGCEAFIETGSRDHHAVYGTSQRKQWYGPIPRPGSEGKDG